MPGCDTEVQALVDDPGVNGEVLASSHQGKHVRNNVPVALKRVSVVPRARRATRPCGTVFHAC